VTREITAVERGVAECIGRVRLSATISSLLLDESESILYHLSSLSLVYILEYSSSNELRGEESSD